MKNQNELSKLKLMLLPCSEPIPNGKVSDYNSAYRLWHSVWAQTLSELDGTTELHSNEFTRHHFMSVIFRDNEAISLFCYSLVNLKLEARKEDSWFASWPKELVNDISLKYDSGLMPAWLSVSNKYRRSKGNYPFDLARFTMEAFAKLILFYGCDVGFGTTRNNRGVNKLIQNVGGTTLLQTVAHNCEVDLVTMRRQDILLKEPNFSTEFNLIWNNREDYWSKNYETSIQRAS